MILNMNFAHANGGLDGNRSFLTPHLYDSNLTTNISNGTFRNCTLPPVNVTRGVVLGLVLVLFMLFALVGNILVILSVAFNRHLQTATNYFIINLAIADLLLSTTVLPFSVTLEIVGHWIFGRIFCDIWAAVDVLCCTASIMSLCAISIDRYIGVRYSLRYPSIVTEVKAVLVIVGVWVLSIVISIGPLLGWKQPAPPDEKDCQITLEPGYALFSSLGSFYIPLTVILVMYVRVYIVAKRTTKNLEAGVMKETSDSRELTLRIHCRNIQDEALVSKSKGHHLRSSLSVRLLKFSREKKAAKTLGIVMGMFILCWLPFFIALPLDLQMERESEEREILEKLGTALNISDGGTEKQNASSGQLSCEPASCRLSTVDGDVSGASGNVEKPQLDNIADDQELAEEHFFECKESLETDVFANVEEEVTNLQQEDDSEIKEAQKLEFDEEYLRELEKDLPEEEKKRRQNESLTLKEVGNGQFKKGEYADAENSYTEALDICPACNQKDRSILYSNRAAARMKLGNKEDAISDSTKAIELNPNYIRALLRRAELYEKTEKLDEALQDYKTIVEKDPSVVQAREACMRLPQQIEERNEKMKEEMLGKLKDLGNMVLRPFGLSTDNFLLNKDPNSGSYSVNFVQNPNNNNR